MRETYITETDGKVLAEIEKDYYCAAKHLHSLLEDAKHNRIASFAAPCIDCKYIMHEMKCNTGAAYGRFQRLGNITGITFAPTTKKPQGEAMKSKVKFGRYGKVTAKKALEKFIEDQIGLRHWFLDNFTEADFSEKADIERLQLILQVDRNIIDCLTEIKKNS